MLDVNLLRGAAVMCLWLTALPAVAQAPLDTDEGSAAAGGEQQATDVGVAEMSLERELERAREQMESAAREVARLSRELAGPIVNGVTRRFRYAGQRAMLGVNIEDTELGAEVVGVSPNGPAAAAGLAVGDIIIAIDGAELAEVRRSGGSQQSPSEVLLAQMANVDAGESVELRVLRDGDYRDVTVQAREFQPQQFFEQHKPDFAFDLSSPNAWSAMFTRSKPWADMQLVALTPELGAYFGTDKGLLVVRAPDDTALGLQDGDVILEIGGREPLNPEDAVRIFASSASRERLRLTILRHQRREALEIEIPVEPPG